MARCIEMHVLRDCTQNLLVQSARECASKWLKFRCSCKPLGAFQPKNPETTPEGLLIIAIAFIPCRDSRVFPRSREIRPVIEFRTVDRSDVPLWYDSFDGHANTAARRRAYHATPATLSSSSACGGQDVQVSHGCELPKPVAPV